MLPWFQWTTIQLGPVPIQVWGLWVALGIVLATTLLIRRLGKRGVKRETILDLVLYVILGGFVGARLFHIGLYEPLWYVSHPLEIFKVWHGGLSSFGGFTGAAISFWIFKKRRGLGGFTKYMSLRELSDELSVASLYGWMVGRIGCVMIHDHLGVQCNCVLALNKPDGSRFDMALLEIIGLLPLAVLFFVLRKKRFEPGVRSGILLMYYGALRFGLDFFRATDIANADVRYLGLTPAQYLSILMLVIGGRVMMKTR